MAQAARKLETAEVTALPIFSKVQPQWVFKDHQGGRTTEYMVYLPPKVWVSQLHEQPKLWSQVQGNSQGGLRQFDTLRLVSYDRTRMTRATVTYADQFTATIDVKEAQRNTLDLSVASLRENAVARIICAGPWYAIQRKSDGVLIGRELPDMKAANRELDRHDTDPVPR